MPALLSNFESVGDNCEFGFVQRSQGCEDGGLLRWSLLTGVDALVRGLDTRFAGTYEFDNLVPAGGGGMVFDHVSGIAFHTQMTSIEENGVWLFKHDELTRRDLHAAECSKIRYLIEKFIDTLVLGKKTLVFKQNQNVSIANVDRIFNAIRRYGDCKLLYVVCDQHELHGSVHKERDGLVRGVIDRFAPYDQADNFSKDQWLSICDKSGQF